MSAEKMDIGIINEVGDLGLGYTELTEDDKKKLKDSMKNAKKENVKNVNESK